MLSGRTTVQGAAVAALHLQRFQLRIGFCRHRRIHNPHQLRLQLGVIELDQIGPADGVDRHKSVENRPVSALHAVAVPAHLQPDDAPAKCLVESLGIGCIIAEIRHDQGIVVVIAIDLGKFAGPCAAVKTDRKFSEIEDAKSPRWKGAVAADDRG